MTLPLDPAPGPSPDAGAERNAAISRQALRQAGDELAKQDLWQASEKAWGAAAYAVKAVAEKRRWFSEADWKLQRIASVISDEQGDPEILHCYAAARNAHFNFYRHEYDARDVEQAIAAAAYLVMQLDVWLAEGYAPPEVSEAIALRRHILEQPASENDRRRLTGGRMPLENRPPVVPAPVSGAEAGAPPG